MDRHEWRHGSGVLAIASEAEWPSVTISNVPGWMAVPAFGGLAMAVRAFDTPDKYNWRTTLGGPEEVPVKQICSMKHARTCGVGAAWRKWAYCLLWVLAVSRIGVAEDWLQWGGPRGDFTVEAGKLAEIWPEGGPKQLWKRPLGDGYSAILFDDGRVYTMYSEGDEEVVVSLDAASGGTVWEQRTSREFWPDMTQQFGPGPNATPLIVGDRIFTVGISGQLQCLDLATGKSIWKHDLPGEFGRKKRVEEYGYSASPLEYQGRIIVQVGGDDFAVIAFDPKEGSVVWKCGPGGVSYAGATITKLAGVDQYIYFEPEGVVGLDPSTGKTLWKSPIEFNNGNHLTPIVKCDDEHLWAGSQFLTGGGRLLRIVSEGGAVRAEEVWFERKLRASHWTLIRLGDFIYGSIGDNGASFLSAFEWKTGKTAWRQRGFHKAQSLYADGKLLFLDENGQLALAKVSPEGLKVLASAQVTEPVSWTIPTLVGTKLYVRDRKNILALDLGEGG